MQLRSIKKSFARQQHFDGVTNDSDLATTQTSTTKELTHENASRTSIMSLTNILMNAKSNSMVKEQPLDRKHLSVNQQPTSKRHQDINNRLRFNVCGDKFEILESTVQRYPNTLLADSARRERFWDENYEEYYLDRNRACFEAVLTYYQSSGILIRPQNIPDVLFLRELQFYDLGEEVLQKVRGEKEETETKNEEKTEKGQKSSASTVQSKVWDLFEHPETSTAARAMAWFSCAIVLLSIILFCVETLPKFREKDDSGKTKNYNTFFIMETFCIGWFTFEYLTRLISSPNKWRFVKEALNIIDLIAILPYFLNFALSGEDSNVSSVAILRAVRLVRVFRVFKLSRYSTGLRILGMTLKASVGELGLLLFFLSVGVVLFASAIYYAEMQNTGDNTFRSIPHAFWWAIVTMTTVGYGDMYPTTLIGKCIGSICACSGILAIALPVPVIVANFERFYSKSQEETKRNSEESNRKAAKYRALKKFFDRLRHRDSPERGTNRTDEYYDMGGKVPEEVCVTSEETGPEYSLLEKKNNGEFCLSSV